MAVARADMLQHARADAPNECCGLLVGRRGVIEGSVRARNLQASPTRYLIDPQDHFAAMRSARAQGLHVVGAYHSHPGGAPTPSPSDVAEASGGSEFLYVIVSPSDDEVRGYFVKNGEINFVDISTEGASFLPS
jgi:[CysO sulfur-carrier protein]-S-L-cysteine hydrolase